MTTLTTRTSLRRSRYTAFAAMVFTIASSTATAQEWGFVPQLGVGGEFDDNANLSTRTDQETELNGLLFDARAEIGYISPSTDFFIIPRVRTSSYSNKPEFDSDDLFTEFHFNHDTQSSKFGIRGRFAEENVRTAERADADLDIDDPDDIPDDSTEAASVEGTRQKYQFRPSFEYRLSDQSRLITKFDHTTVNYDSILTAAGTLNDYSDNRLRVSYERDFSGRSTGIILATGRTYDTTNSINDTTGLGISAGLARRLSSATTLTALVGFESVEEDSVRTDPTYVVDVALVQRLEVITVIAQYKRNISASGRGILLARDAINFRFTRQLSEKLSAGLGVRAYRTDSIGNSSSNVNERDYVQLRSQFTWNLTPTFWVEADYRYTFIRRSTLGESANSNNVNLWFVYRPRANRR